MIEDPFGLDRVEVGRSTSAGRILVYPRLVELDRLFSEGGARCARRPAAAAAPAERLRPAQRARLPAGRVAAPRALALDGQARPADGEGARGRAARRGRRRCSTRDAAVAASATSFESQVRAAGVDPARARHGAGRRPVLVVNSRAARRSASTRGRRLARGARAARRRASRTRGAPLAALLADEAGAAAARRSSSSSSLAARRRGARRPARAARALGPAQRLARPRRLGRASPPGGAATPYPALLRLQAAGIPVAVVRARRRSRGRARRARPRRWPVPRSGADRARAALPASSIASGTGCGSSGPAAPGGRCSCSPCSRSCPPCCRGRRRSRSLAVALALARRGARLRRSTRGLDRRSRLLRPAGPALRATVSSSFYDVALPFDPPRQHATCTASSLARDLRLRAAAVALAVAARRPALAALGAARRRGLAGDAARRRRPARGAGDPRRRARRCSPGSACRGRTPWLAPARRGARRRCALAASASPPSRRRVPPLADVGPRTRGADDAGRASSYVWNSDYSGLTCRRRPTVLQVRRRRGRYYWRATTLDDFSVDGLDRGPRRPANRSLASRRAAADPSLPQRSHDPAGWVTETVTVAALRDPHLLAPRHAGRVRARRVAGIGATRATASPRASAARCATRRYTVLELRAAADPAAARALEADLPGPTSGEVPRGRRAAPRRRRFGAPGLASSR